MKFFISTFSDSKKSELLYDSINDEPSLIFGICENAIQKIFFEWKTPENQTSNNLNLEYQFDANSKIFSLKNITFELLFHNRSQKKNLIFVYNGTELINSKYRSYLCTEVNSLEMKNNDQNATLNLDFSLPFHHKQKEFFSKVFSCKESSSSALQIGLIVTFLILALIAVVLYTDKMLTATLTRIPYSTNV